MVVVENRYLLPRIIKFLDQALEGQCLESKTQLYTTHTRKTERHTQLKHHGIEVNIIIWGNGENRDVFNYCKYLSSDYIYMTVNFTFTVCQLYSRRLEYLFPASTSSLCLCTSDAAPTQILVIQESKKSSRTTWNLLYSILRMSYST